MSDDTGSVVTVEGRLDPEDLGITMTHEHTFLDAVDPLFEIPDKPYERSIALKPVSIETLWYTKQNPENHRDNILLDSIEEAVDEVRRYREAGGQTIVDVTPKNLGMDPERVRGVALRTGVQYVHGTAYYTRGAHPDSLNERSMEEIEEEFVSDVREGIDDTDVRAGLVGEIGVSDEVYEMEEKVLRAGARAARRTGAPLSVHPPGRTPESQRDRTYPTARWALELLDVIEEEGLPPERVVFCHMDRSLYADLEYQSELADRGTHIEYDLFGLEAFYKKYDDGYPSDNWRVDAVEQLIEEGYASQILLSHDIHQKIQRTKYGGYGYGHVLENIVPRLRSRGVSREDIDSLLIENPKQLLTFVTPD